MITWICNDYDNHSTEVDNYEINHYENHVKDIDNANNKTCPHQQPPPPPAPSMAPPPQHIVPPPAASIMHSSDAPTSVNTGILSGGSTQTSSTVTYPSPIGFQHPPSGPPTPTLTPVPTPGPTPVASAPTPSHTPTPAQTQPPTATSTVPNCSACGCTGHCGVGLGSGVPTLHYNYMWPGHPGAFPGCIPHMLPVTSNGLITHPGLPFTHPMQAALNLPNGLTHEVLYNTGGLTLVQPGQQHSPVPAPNFMAPFPPGLLPGGPAMGNPGLPGSSAGSRDSCSSSGSSTTGAIGSGSSSHGNGNSNLGNKGKTPTCCNCGASGHVGTECKEATMDAMTQAGMGEFLVQKYIAFHSNTTVIQ